MSNRFKRACTIFIVSILFIIINKKTYANTYEQLTKLDGVYYYVKEDGNVYSSGDENILKRINDTYYFVDNGGRVYVRTIPGYKLVENDSLDILLGKKIIYENIKSINANSYFGNKYYEIKEVRELDSSIDDAKIYYNNPIYMKDINMCLIGDSYAYNMAVNNKNIEKYSLAPGYVISAIKNEVLPLVNFKDVKYCVLFIGPNDLMNSTNFIDFQKDIYYICDYIVKKGAKPILMSYLGIDSFGETGKELQKHYDHIVQCAALAHNGIYIFVDDIDEIYGRDAIDPVHPRKEFYKTAYSRVYDRLKKDSLK